MKICIFTNQVAGGWSPEDLDVFLGGSEECVVLLAEAFVRKGYVVSVFHSQKENSPQECRGVNYFSREEAKAKKEDIWITFKDPMPWIAKEEAPIVKIHWSSDVETPWDVDYVDRFVHLSEYHETRNIFVSRDKSVVIPHGVDIDHLDKNSVDKVKHTILYCSSPDRGLVKLLNDWETIKKYFSELKLAVAYGFGNFEKMSTNTQSFVAMLKEQMRSLPDVEFVGELSRNQMEKRYWMSEYWCLPLNRPDSELFCLNALKSRYCGCKPVVNKIGALKNTVEMHIPYENFVQGDFDVVYPKSLNAVEPLTWDEIVENHWMPLFNEIQKEKE